MATVKEQPPIFRNRLILTGETWETYERALETFRQRRLRITFDRGDLEIMTLSPLHEWLKDCLRRFVDILLEELDLPFACYGSMTFKRKSKDRGLEPDECYWIQSESQVRGISEYDPETDPPPDLVLEVDVTSSSLDRIGIYEALGVSEVWRLDEEQLQAHVLDKKGKLKVRRMSAVFPGLKIADLVAFLEIAQRDGQAKMVKSFRGWVREQIESGRVKGADD